mmetsp:Transcript_42063/g.104709  ORF Transcript_42063/g.104709 Transcript_42063/m.104709 type:complete len:271 (+) Transcript_42063:597-1409(+)
MLGVTEAHGEDDQLRRPLLLAARHLLESAVLAHIDVDCLDGLQIAVAVPDKLPRKDGVGARVRAEVVLCLLVAVVGAKDAWPSWPWVGGRALVWWLRKKLEVGEGLTPMSKAGSNAVSACVAAADDYHVLALRVDEAAIVLGFEQASLRIVAREEALLVLGEELHCKHDAIELTAGDRQVVGYRGAGGEHDGIIAQKEVGAILGHRGVAQESYPFRLHELESPLHSVLVKLHVWDTIREQASRLGGTLNHSDLVAVFFIQFIRCGKACGT